MFQETNAALDLGVIFDSQIALKEQMNKPMSTFLTGDQADRFSIRESSFRSRPKVSFSVLLSLGLIVVMLSLLALLMFSMIKFKE